jgi:hypothetical protein
MLESKRQTKIRNALIKDGYFVTKLTVTSTPGIPDLLAIKDGKALFIEVKQPGNNPTELQLFMHDKLRSFGCEVKVWTDYGTDYATVFRAETDGSSTTESLQMDELDAGGYF